MEDQIRERLAEIIDPFAVRPSECDGFATDRIREGVLTHWNVALTKADMILREFALRPVSQGRVDSESGEVVK